MAGRCYHRLGMAQLATLVNGIKQEYTRQSCTNTNESKTHKIQTRHQQKPPVPGARTRHFRRTILCHKLSTTTASQHVQPKCEYRPCLRGINEEKKNERTVTLPGVGPSRFPRARTTFIGPSCATNRVKQPHLNTCNRNANTVLAFLGSTEVRDAGTSDSEPCSTPSVPYSTEICKRQKTSAPSHFPVLAHHVSRENEPHPVQHHSES